MPPCGQQLRIVPMVLPCLSQGATIIPRSSGWEEERLGDRQVLGITPGLDGIKVCACKFDAIRHT